MSMSDVSELILAAEDCPRDEFRKIHTFSAYEDKVIRKLTAHGPVLLRGGRGSGKSALLIEADRRINEAADSDAISFYLSLRYLPLLRSSGDDYERYFCDLVSKAIAKRLPELISHSGFQITQSSSALQEQLNELAGHVRRRIVLLFDDAAHIGRERPLGEFFDIFRFLSSSQVSCKASIYPGVTQFGTRFDLFNDAVLVDVNRNERSPDFAPFFHSVLRARFESLSSSGRFSANLPIERFAGFLGRSVVGNMRAFVFACNWFEDQPKIGLPEISSCLISLSTEYYWPLLDEVAPKLGVYEPMVTPARGLGETIFYQCAQKPASTVLIHRDYLQRLPKLFEILEYAGFIAKREASRALKSGGRGAAYALNLCNLVEQVSQRRLTNELFDQWLASTGEPMEMHTKSQVLDAVRQPDPATGHDLSIFHRPIDDLARSRAYPYGLTYDKIGRLKEAGLDTVGKVAQAPDEDILRIEMIGTKHLRRIRDVVLQAIWM